MGDIIEIDNRADPMGKLKLFRRCVVGREHDIVAGKSQGIRHHQLRLGGTVCPASEFLQNI